MTSLAVLERRYRRLLAWYPQPFRSRQQDEMLAVLMAGARKGQRRPGLVEAADVVRSALRMRLRAVWSGPRNQGWADGLALFSVVAPLFLLAVTLLEAALPYHLQLNPRFPFFARLLGPNYQISGPALFSQHGFDIAIGGQIIIAALVLLGLRRLALIAIAGSAVCWAVTRYWIPDPLQLLCASVYILEAAALIASPGPRRGRYLMNRGHGVILLLAAAAVQASTLVYEATSPLWPWSLQDPGTSVYLVLSIVLAVAAASLTVALRMGRFFLLLLTAMFYPYVLQLVAPSTSTSSNLIGSPTPAHLALLFFPPLLLAGATIFIAAMPRRPGAAMAGPGEPGVS
jgi:hypothetical protein